MLEQVDERTRIVWVANPANPTGTMISDAEMRRLHAGLPRNVILVIDGAYAEFVDDPTYSDGIDLARGETNVIVTRTFSKLHGLAALRVGWAYAPEAVSDAVNRIRPPFNTSIAGQAAAVAALGDEAFQAEALAHVQRWRPWLTQQLGGLGLDIAPSAANFVLVGFPKEAGPDGEGRPKGSWRAEASSSAGSRDTGSRTTCASPSAWRSTTAPSSTRCRSS